MTQWGMVIDVGTCIGCQTCTVSCQVNNLVPDRVFRTRVVDYERGTYPSVDRRFLPAHCNQCSRPTCVSACPADATRRTEEGVVVVDPEACTGCQSCVVACPYGARTYLDPDHAFDEADPFERRMREENRLGTVTKCDFCHTEVTAAVEAGYELGVDPEATPHCVTSCIADAKHFGDLDDPESEVSRLVAEEDVTQLRPERGTDPNVYYRR